MGRCEAGMNGDGTGTGRYDAGPSRMQGRFRD